MTSFLLDAARPAFRRLHEKGVVSAWYFYRAEVDGLPCILIECRARSGVSDFLLRSQLRSALSIWGGDIEEIRKTARDMTLEQARERFGGDEGIRIYRASLRLSCRLALDLMTAQRDGSFSVSRYEMILSLLFFFLDTLAVGLEEARAAAPQWMRYVGQRIDKTGNLPALLDDRMRSSALQSSPMDDVMENYLLGGWRASPRPVVSVLAPQAGLMRRIGSLFKRNELNFHAGKPRGFVAFHSYFGPLYHRMGISHVAALAVVLLLMKKIESGDGGLSLTSRRNIH